MARVLIAGGLIVLIVGAPAGCGSTSATSRNGHGDATAGDGGASSNTGGNDSGGAASPNTGGDGSTGVGNYCPDEMPTNGDYCNSYVIPSCSYPTTCDAGGTCSAECVGNTWFVSCEPCGSTPQCPANAPRHGSACDMDPTYACVFDSCEDGGTFLAATCKAGAWSVDSRICQTGPCVGGEDDFGCSPGQACVIGPACSATPGGTCVGNPCLTEPFSCACAQVLCPRNSSCDSAQDGRVICTETAPLPSDPTVLVDGLDLNGPLAMYQGTLYAASYTPAPIVAIDATTAATQELGDIGTAYDVAVDQDGVFWIQNDGIRTATLGGTTATILDSTTAQKLAVDATHVYFTTSATDPQSPNSIERVAKNGGLPEVLASAAMPAGIAVDSSGVYFADRNNATNLGLILSVPLSGGTPTSLATQQGFPSAIRLDATHVFWLDEWPPDVKVMAKSAGAPTALYTATAGESTPKGIAIDSENVYFTDSDARSVSKVPIAGGPVVSIATEQVGVSGIAVDDAFVYWTLSCGRVLRAPK